MASSYMMTGLKINARSLGAGFLANLSPLLSVPCPKIMFSLYSSSQAKDYHLLSVDVKNDDI